MHLIQEYNTFEQIVKYIKDTCPTINTTFTEDHIDGYGRSFKCVNEEHDIVVQWGKNFIDREPSEITTFLKKDGVIICEHVNSIDVTDFKMCNEACKDVHKLLKLEDIYPI